MTVTIHCVDCGSVKMRYTLPAAIANEIDLTDQNWDDIKSVAWKFHRLTQHAGIA